MTIAALNRIDAQAAADRHEDALSAAYRTVLTSAGRTAERRFKRTAPLTAAAQPDDQGHAQQPNWTPPNIDELVDLAAIATQTAAKTAPIHKAALKSVANSYRDVGIAFDIVNPLSLTLLGQIGGRSGDVAKSVRDDLAKIIGDSYTSGFSVDKTSAQIRALSDQFSVAQSKMLARTDLNGIANGGSHLAAKEVGVGFKTWLATEDEKTRDTHAEADGQTIPIDDQFEVGGEFCDYPGDPALSDAEACNCRCTLTYADSPGDGSDSGDLVASNGISTSSEGGEMSEAQITIPLEIRIGDAVAASVSNGKTPVVRASKEELSGITIVDAGSGDLWIWDGETFAATGSTDLPLSDRNVKWDAGAARKTLQPADFPKAHFWRDPNGPADQIGSYKFPFAQRVDGTLTAIWGGITAGAQRLSSAKGVDTGAIEGKMRTYYSKAAKQYKDPTIKAPFAIEPNADDMEPHAYADGGDGMCAICGMGPGAAIHETSMSAALGSPSWRAVLCVEGEPTEDGRLLEPGSITWRDLPLTLLCQIETQPGHDGAEVCGRIDRIYREGNQIIGEGIFDSGQFGLEAARLVTEQVLRGISVDLAVLEYEIRAAPDADDQMMAPEDGMIVADDPDELFVVTDGVIGAATICPFQAIANATIEVLTASGPFRVARITSLAGLETLTASAVEAEAPLRPPAEWFDDPKLDRPTNVTVNDDGRVFGHVAPWRGCHTGYAGRCVPPPRSRTGYAHFHVGRVETAEGDLISIGKLTLASGHADIHDSSAAARRHYDNSAAVAAFVRAGEDAHGVWIAGALRPGVSPEQIQDLLANPLSGDWRNGEMVAAHAVPVPGFPILQASAIGADGEEETALILTSTVGLLEDDEPVDFAVRSRVLAARARGGVAALAELARS